MYWEEIKKTKHFEKYHKGTLPWSIIISLIYLIKKKETK